MSCVPSMSAYAAIHTRICQHEDKPSTQVSQTIETAKEKKSFWEWGAGLKLIFLGHDGVALAPSNYSSQQKDQKLASKPLDLWSRVCHLSGEGDHLSSPESPDR